MGEDEELKKIGESFIYHGYTDITASLGEEVAGSSSSVPARTS